MLRDESSVIVNCPSCGAQLSAPRDAAGRKARCKSCDHRFVIPKADDLMEDTISGWIVQDVEAMHKEDDRRSEARDPQSGPAKKSGKKKPPSSADDAVTAGDDKASPGGTVMAVPVVAAPTPRPNRSSASTPADDESAYPSRLTASNSRTPHLVVARCDTAGVRMRFDGKWLKQEGFRASMPVRCVFSGLADRSKLIARPLVFLDRCQDRQATLEQVTARHENRVLADAHPREVMRKMGVIARMMPPFHYAMPYYVGLKYAHLFIHTEARDRRDGGTSCDLLVPDGVCAVDWLARVNGVCGPEFELLESDVSLLHGDAWRELSENCRQRIAVWCKLQPREVFQMYLSDADFGRRDEGLAGIIVTDQRLVFCQYHHRGQVRLDAEHAKIVVRGEGAFANLMLVVGTDRARMVKLARADLDKLAKVLDIAGIEIAEE